MCTSPFMSAKKKDSARYSEVRNAKVLRDYFVDERFEAGLALKGTEVKSIRAGRAQINDAFGRHEKGTISTTTPVAFANCCCTSMRFAKLCRHWMPGVGPSCRYAFISRMRW